MPSGAASALNSVESFGDGRQRRARRERAAVEDGEDAEQAARDDPHVDRCVAAVAGREEAHGRIREAEADR